MSSNKFKEVSIEIESLENQNITDEEKETIEEHRKILNKVNKKIKFILGEH
jgi:hypothetical protein